MNQEVATDILTHAGIEVVLAKQGQEAIQVLTQDHGFDAVLMVLGALVPLLSAVASLVNHAIRRKVDAGQNVSSVLSGTGTVLNLASVNLDKAIQLARMVHPAKGSATKENTAPNLAGVPAPDATPIVPPPAPLAAPAPAPVETPKG
jgi:hypothetical protein